MFKFNPSRTLAAVAVLAQSVIALVAFIGQWPAELVLLVTSVDTAFLAVLGTMFIDAKTVSVAGMQALEDANKALDNKPKED